MNADGSSQTRLTTNAAEDTTPDWQWQAERLPPPKPVDRAELVGVRWKESVFSGSLRVSGRVPGLSRLQLALRQGKRVAVAAGLTVSKGAFTRRLALPDDLTPGLYTLEVTAVGSPTVLSPQKLPVRLAAPPEGVVSEAWASSTVGGPPLARVPSDERHRLGALPARRAPAAGEAADDDVVRERERTAWCRAAAEAAAVSGHRLARASGGRRASSRGLHVRPVGRQDRREARDVPRVVGATRWGTAPASPGCSGFGCWFGRVVVVLLPLEVELDRRRACSWSARPSRRPRDRDEHRVPVDAPEHGRGRASSPS